MLQHESQEQTTTTPAAEIRVTSEELAQAINALQASKDEAARHLAGTVPIGQVVEELKLEATPEEVWAQVQKQRQAASEKAAAEKAARDKTAEDVPHEAFHRAAQEARQAAAQAMAAAQAVAQAASAQTGAHVYARPQRYGRGKTKWWALFGVGMAIYGITHGSLVHLPTGATLSSASQSFSSSNQTLTFATKGENVDVSGDNDILIFLGNCPTLTVSGDNNHIFVEGHVGQVVTDGDNNSVIYADGPAPAVSGDGDGNKIEHASP